MRVLAVNAGSSTLKLSLLDGDQVLADQTIETSSDGDVGEALSSALESFESPDAVGHRVVHGGGVYSSAVRISGEVRARLESFVELAPLHQPPALQGIDLVGRLLPDVPAVACFDTAFHATLAPEAYTYAVPSEWRERYGLRRYGFHGLSHAYCARRALESLDSTGASRLVICHLGAGASLSAVRDGVCVDTTMGFTPLEGLVMATRSGDVDPGMLIWLLRHADLDVDELDDALQHRSGLAGLAGTSDMREVESRAREGDADARLALAVYVHRLRSRIGGMAASLGGVDALVFTGGVGENAASIRSDVVAGLGFLGAQCLVIPAREDLQIAAEVRELLS